MCFKTLASYNLPTARPAGEAADSGVQSARIRVTASKIFQNPRLPRPLIFLSMKANANYAASEFGCSNTS